MNRMIILVALPLEILINHLADSRRTICKIESATAIE